MAESYAVKNIVFESGERFSLLVDRRTGMPLFDPTVFTLTEFRARNWASATIEQVLRALKVFVLFCEAHQIDKHYLDSFIVSPSIWISFRMKSILNARLIRSRARSLELVPIIRQTRRVNFSTFNSSTLSKT